MLGVFGGDGEYARGYLSMFAYLGSLGHVGLFMYFYMPASAHPRILSNSKCFVVFHDCVSDCFMSYDTHAASSEKTDFSKAVARLELGSVGLFHRNP